MTFTEAAVEILRLVGRPLHYKKITELAIERNLLSHVGKAPELTMSSRLATMVKKDRGEEPIVKVKPGVFALREFTPQMMALADSEEDIDLSQVPASPPPSAEAVVEKAPRAALPGSDVFPAEEDDDKPILGGSDEEESEEEEGGERGRGRRRRRRREEPTIASEEPRVEGAAPEAERPRERERGRDRERHDRPERHDRHREPDRSRDVERPRDAVREDRNRDRDRDRRDGHRDAPRHVAVDMSREPGEGELVGRDLSDAVAAVLSSENRPLSYTQIAEQLVRRGRLVGDAVGLAPTIAASVRADAGRSARARFRHSIEGVALYDWFLPRDASYRERDMLRASERHQETVRRAFIRKLADLPPAGFAELMASWLNAEGVSGIRGVRRPTSSSQEMHFAGTLRRGFEETRMAILVLRSGAELTRERIVELRGSLHHYNATLGWVVTLGSVPKPARDEANAPGATPIAAFDAMALAEAMEARSVGIRAQSMPFSVLDLDTLDALRGSAEPPFRDGRESGQREERPREERQPREERPREERQAREPREERQAREERQPREPREERQPRAEVVREEEPVDGVVAEATESGVAPSVESAESSEGSRRRRRRRRRRGGAQGAADLTEDGEEVDADEQVEEGAVAAPAVEDDEAESSTLTGVESPDLTGEISPDEASVGGSPDEVSDAVDDATDDRGEAVDDEE